MNNRKIYIVDDDADDRAMLVEALKGIQPGIEIVEADNGFDFLQSVDNEAKDSVGVFLLDMNMPGLSGLEVLSKLRLNPVMSSTPAVMLTTSSDVSLMKDAYDLGVDSFITKPIYFPEYAKIANHLLSNYLG